MKNAQDTLNHYHIDERFIKHVSDYMMIKTYPLVFVEVSVWD